MESQADEKKLENVSSEEIRTEPLLLTSAQAESETKTEEPQALKMNGGSVTLDHLGPMVINTDGTISRISNWANLSEIERTRTLRLVAQRNEARISRLKTKEESSAQNTDQAESNQKGFKTEPSKDEL
uniref:Uncharacterized protein n=2 Tax=Phakopsora pachyrhizi TaxID=170000 RepID=A0A0S1MIR1_PHAPC